MKRVVTFSLHERGYEEEGSVNPCGLRDRTLESNSGSICGDPLGKQMSTNN